MFVSVPYNSIMTGPISFKLPCQEHSTWIIKPILLMWCCIDKLSLTPAGN